MDTYVFGMDEVGRGALVGDLVVAACCFTPDAAGCHARQLARDSKAFKSRAARAAAAEGMRAGVHVSFARRSPEEIDRLNIRGAVLSAFEEAARALLDQVSGHNVALLWDGKDAPKAIWPHRVVESRAVVKGDATVPEIAAASVFAKVLRDEEMDALAARFPAYGWEKNAGYGTAPHIRAIAAHGLTPFHRSWARKFCT